MPSNLMGLATSDNSQAPLGGSQIDAAIDNIEPYVVLRYATTTARDTAHPATVGGRKAGTVVWVPTVGYHQTSLTDGGAWVPLATRDVYLGGEPAISGTAPSAGTFRVRQDFTAVVSVAAGGYVSGYFPVAFGNGITSFTISAGDWSSGLAFVTPNVFYLELWQWVGVAYQAGGALVTTGNPVRVNVSAVGW